MFFFVITFNKIVYVVLIVICQILTLAIYLLDEVGRSRWSWRQHQQAEKEISLDQKLFPTFQYNWKQLTQQESIQPNIKQIINANK